LPAVIFQAEGFAKRFVPPFFGPNYSISSPTSSLRRCVSVRSLFPESSGIDGKTGAAPLEFGLTRWRTQGTIDITQVSFSTGSTSKRSYYRPVSILGLGSS